MVNLQIRDLQLGVPHKISQRNVVVFFLLDDQRLSNPLLKKSRFAKQMRNI
jgi:hypothetical protein